MMNGQYQTRVHVIAPNHIHEYSRMNVGDIIVDVDDFLNEELVMFVNATKPCVSMSVFNTKAWKKVMCEAGLGDVASRQHLKVVYSPQFEKSMKPDKSTQFKEMFMRFLSQLPS